MFNESTVGGLAIIAGIVGFTVFIGVQFKAGIDFASAQSLDAAKETRALRCTFYEGDAESNIAGNILIRDGILHVDVRETKIEVPQTPWAFEIDSNDSERMATKASPEAEFVSIENYPQVQEQVMSDLENILKSEKLNCFPWWFPYRYQFAL